MKQSSLKIAAAVFAAVGSVCAGELASIQAPADFLQAKRVSFADGVFSFKGKGTIESVVKLPVDPKKTYRLSGEFRSKEGTAPVRLYFGFSPLDAGGKAILPYHIHVVPGSATETVADAAKGDRVILVRKAAWNVKARFGLVAFQAKDDLSDLPNRNVIGIAADGIQPEGDNLKITLKAPLASAVPAGTKVRQQLAGETYIYCAGSSYVNDQWTPRSGIISGFTRSTRSNSKFWPGTAFVRIMIHFSNADKNSVTEFRNIKVEEVE